MNIMNRQVHHHQFGMGTVISQASAIVTVQFCEEYGTKKFLFPSAFESFLELCDPVAKAEMDNELRQIRERAEEKQRKRAEEDEKRREEERRALLEQKRKITKKRSSAAKAPAKPKKKHAETDAARTAESVVK